MKTISEVFDEVTKAPTKEQKIQILRANNNFALKYILTGSYHPDIHFVFDAPPQYKKSGIPDGMGYTSIHQELGRAYLFEKNNPKVSPNLTQKRKEELLIQMLEALEDREAEIFVNMLFKKQIAKGLTYELVSEAFPGMLP